jgi:phosphoserine aminotransferase
MKPQLKPTSAHFSSGPCKKRPDWNIDALKDAAVGRSHRAAIGKDKLNKVITESKRLLGIPEDYLVGIMPASDTGAVEAALWSMIGACGVDVFAWESFGGDWVKDLKNELKISDLRIFQTDYGILPDLTQAGKDRDVIFTWNGTTSGVVVPNGDWISDDREGLTICDATSAVFAFDLPWEKLDVTTYSWQKVMGSEAAHGMIVLSPRAVERLKTFTPDRAIPKIFRMAKNGEIIGGIFKGATINTPSMLAVEDALDSLKWIESIGGAAGMISRSQANLAVVKDWVTKTPWVGFLAVDEKTLSNTSICLKIIEEDYLKLSTDEQAIFAKDITKILESEEVAFDIAAYRDAPAGFRIWGGGTVEASDVELLLPWFDYAFAEVKGKYIN